MRNTASPALPDLDYFTGTDNWWQMPLCPGFSYTDGARYVAQTAAAYWLIADIFYHTQDAPRLKNEAFQAWKLTVTDQASAELTCEDGNKRVLFSHWYDFTSFPRPGITLWLVNKVLLLPSEY